MKTPSKENLIIGLFLIVIIIVGYDAFFNDEAEVIYEEAEFVDQYIDTIERLRRVQDSLTIATDSLIRANVVEHAKYVDLKNNIEQLKKQENNETSRVRNLTNDESIRFFSEWLPKSSD